LITAAPPRPSPAYRADIDGLRGVAILTVLVFHSFPSMMRGGFVGVDVFFVISGYLVSGIILRGLADGSFSFAHFYANRVRRIVPALAVTLAAVYVAGWWLLLLPEFSQLGKHIAGSVAFAQNIVLWSEAGYFDNASASKPLLHLWSLGVEEQFYLLIPAMLWLTTRVRQQYAVAMVLAAVTTAAFALNVGETRLDASAAYFLLPYRAWELTAGGLLAVFAPGRTRPVAREASAAMGLTLIAVSAVALSRTTVFPGWAATVPVGGAALSIAAGPDSAVNRRLLAHPAAVGLGLISYPLYLWHWPILTFLRLASGGNPTRPARAMAVAVSVMLAAITYRFVERPIRRRTHVPAKVAGLVMASMLLGAIGVATVRDRGIPTRFPAAIRQIAAYTFDPRQSYRAGVCYVTSRPGRVFTVSDFAPSCGAPATDKPTLLLWGDSFSASMYSGLEAAFADRRILQYSASMCPPILGLHEQAVPDCPAINAFVLDAVVRHPPREILLEADWRSHRWMQVERTIAALRAAGVRRVIVAGPLPYWPEPLPDIITRAALRLRSGVPPVVIRNASLGAQLEFDQRLREFALERQADYVSPLRLLCDEHSGCLDRDANASLPLTPLAFDNAHLTDVGSRLLGRLLRTHMTARGEPM
jgi:peptidoglycan/LPS O-acetylase OafA/YrhL